MIVTLTSTAPEKRPPPNGPLQPARMGRSASPVMMKISPSSTNTTTSHIPTFWTRVSAATKRGPTRPRYSPVATTARMPETPSRSAGRYAAYPVRSEMVFSTSGSWMWRRTAARSQATAKPTATPPAPTRRNRPVAQEEDRAKVRGGVAVRRQEGRAIQERRDENQKDELRVELDRRQPREQCDEYTPCEENRGRGNGEPTRH